MISFTILTSTPLVVRDFFVSRGIMKIEDGQLIGTRSGTEWIEIPNPVQTSLEVYDTRRVYIVKVAGECEAYETEGEEQTTPRLIWQRTKLGKWIFANSSAFSYTDATGKVFRGRKVNNQDIWLIREDDASQIHAWQ